MATGNVSFMIAEGISFEYMCCTNQFPRNKPLLLKSTNKSHNFRSNPFWHIIQMNKVHGLRWI